jgi:riboflavin kinase/FMN adenylyltransferase
MLLVRDAATLPGELTGASVALGNFDGVHLGHQSVIGRARSFAEANGLKLLLVTFEPHPRTLFTAEAEPFRLTPMRIKLELFEALGAAATLCLRFDRELASMSADQFIDNLLVGALKARHVVIGHDFCFGTKRSGNAAHLMARGPAAGFTVEAVEAQVAPDGEPYSSTRIRDYLRAGEPDRAAHLLGRPFRIEGHVQHGDKRGRLLGFPTANLTLDGYLVPRKGVYAVSASIAGKSYGGVANLGLRPTIGTDDVRLETHIFDFDGDIYGAQIAVDLLHFIRAEQKFDALDALKAQIAADSAEARRLL